MKVINEATDDAVPTDDRPIIRPGIDVDLSCRSCGAEFPLDEAGLWVPGGHGKWCEYECPECGARVAKKKGTNHRVDEDFVGLPIAEAFEGKHDEDADRLRKGSEVDVDAIGDSIEVVIYAVDYGTFERFEVDQSDIVRPGDDRFRDDWFDADTVDAVVVYPSGTEKPIGYPTEWDEDDEDFRPGEANKSVTRFVV